MAGSSNVRGPGQQPGFPQAPATRTPAQQTSAPPQIEQSLVDAAKQRPAGPQFFGYHTDASIMARLAQQGIAPNAVNLRIAQQMLRYGLPLSPATLGNIRQMWQAMGAMSLVDLEALIALFSMGKPIDAANMGAMLQLLSGGPMSHLFARLTLALKQLPPGMPGAAGKEGEQLKQLLQAFWKLGNGPEALPAELPQFRQLTGRIQQLLGSGLPGRVTGELATELAALHQLFQAQHLLQAQRQGTTIYIPFFQWREQQPMPGEFLVQADRENAAQAAANYTQITVAVDTRNLGRVTIDFTASRGHLGLQFEVQDQAVKQLVDAGLPTLRKRLGPRTGYTIAGLSVVEVGQGRSISVLLPKRRDLRKLGRAIGVL
ncbi:MAG: flagellar hook-length control protein FliK [Candidatus Sericytochromatia bacterium]|nr:flagellar hook-length control protein FliK [Candidatus Tanganyikabacteria bacterium]